ncbi:hypothetical protein HPB51_013941 [Rhipicephalus microplus]|uniref:Glycosyltransferase family 92 protein n=1 Tax=Rhipicephalus microplus TaxID=6941 RepID=A0A9J6DGZ8_RHIMP|nr:uncharacterized protein LOC119173737 [Rhipicephalus microplus]KAH8021266.1 hypothetical protein HPB51_013941 [Rhipicephalus microplus]
MTCSNENERLLTRYMDDWEGVLIEQLQNGSAGALPRKESAAWKVLLKDSVYVFSAYLANASIWGVHVVSLVRKDAELSNSTAPSIECFVRTADGKSLRRPVIVKKMWEEFRHDFVRAHLICPLEGVAGIQPTAVILRTASRSDTEQVELPVQKLPETAPNKCCSLCVRPTYGTTTRLWEVVEFVTHYKLLGARSFFFYDLEMSQSMLRLVERLQAEGWDITLVPFKLPIPYNYSNIAWGQTAMLSDCAFRSRFKTEYFVNVDFDELIVPGVTYGANLSTLINSVEHGRGAGRVGSLVLKNRVFCYEHQLNRDYVRRDVLPLRSTILNTHLSAVDNNFTLKYIARARAVCSAAIHRVVEFCIDSQEAVRMNSNELVVNHYRRCCSYGVGKEKSWGVDFRNADRLFVDDSAKALGSSFYGLLPFVARSLQPGGRELRQNYDTRVINDDK